MCFKHKYVRNEVIVNYLVVVLEGTFIHTFKDQPGAVVKNAIVYIHYSTKLFLLEYEDMLKFLKGFYVKRCRDFFITW